MIVRMGTAPRAAGLGFEAFQEHWRSEHGDIAGAIPGLRSYLQNHAVLRNGKPILPYAGLDACAEIEFDDIDSMWAGFNSDYYQRDVRKDESHMIDGARFNLLLADRVVLLDGPERADSVRLFEFWRAAPDAEVSTLAAKLGEQPESDDVLRHELLVEIAGTAEGQPSGRYQVVESRVFADADTAERWTTSQQAFAVGWDLVGTGQVVGRMIVHVIPTVERPGRLG